MAKVMILGLLMMVMIALVLVSIDCKDDEDSSWFEDHNNLAHGGELEKKLEVFTYYAQDILSGADETVYEVAKSSITSVSETSFGLVKVVDKRLTAEPYPFALNEIGRLQGLMTSADLTTPGEAMNLHLYFSDGKYKDSTLCILGRYHESKDGKEYAVVGGTGIFRFAKGYVLSTPYYDGYGRWDGDDIYTFHLTKYEFIQKPGVLND